jgi:hypothetical protein
MGMSSVIDSRTPRRLSSIISAMAPNSAVSFQGWSDAWRTLKRASVDLPEPCECEPGACAASAI